MKMNLGQTGESLLWKNSMSRIVSLVFTIPASIIFTVTVLNKVSKSN
jgi:hypothetical protein